MDESVVTVEGDVMPLLVVVLVLLALARQVLIEKTPTMITVKMIRLTNSVEIMMRQNFKTLYHVDKGAGLVLEVMADDGGGEGIRSRFDEKAFLFLHVFHHQTN